MPSKLHVFDFDGTLFNSPSDTPETRKKYERATGLPWIIDKEMSRELSKKHKKFIGMRRGWWGRAETLEPPLVPDPAPAEWFIKEACDALHQSKADPDIMTVILTGRHAGIKGQVYRICDQGKLVMVEKKKAKDGKVFYENADPNVICWFMGENGPAPQGNKPAETLPWKLWIIQQLLGLNSDIAQIEFWEDREEHIAAFGKLEFFAGEVLVHPITT